jgi:hypothetical protein
VKTSETSPDERKAQLRRQFLQRLRDERMVDATSRPRGSQDEKSPLAQRREEPAKAGPLSPFWEKQRTAQQSGRARSQRNQELTTSTLRNQPEQAEIRAAKLREERQNAQEIEAAQIRRNEQLKADALRKGEREQAEARAIKVREAAEARRNADLERAAQEKQEAERQAEIRAATIRQQQRSTQQSRTSQAQREQEGRAALPQKQEAERQAEIRAAKVRERQRIAQQAEADRAQRDRELKAAALRKQEAAREEEQRAARLRHEQRNSLQSEAQLRRDEELQAATLRNQKQEQLHTEREQDAVAVQAAEKQRQEQLQEEASRIQAEAKRAKSQTAPPRKPEMEVAAGAPQMETRLAQAARSRTRMALRTAARQRTPATSTANAQTTPAADQVFYLSASTSLLVDENNEPVNLRGVTVRGLDSIAPAPGQSFPAALALDDSSLLELNNHWAVNLVRLPFQAKTILSGNGTVTAAAMLTGFDATVAAVTEAGAYVLLAVEAPSGAATPAPDASTTQAWQTLAARYQNEPRVLFEVFASPAPLAANWPQSASALVTAIRQQNPTSLIFLGSGHGGADVTGLPLTSSTGDPLPNIVYTIAVSATNFPNPDDGHFRALAESHPVFVSMWSDDGSDFGRMTARVADLFERFGIGWAAANWNADPLLVANAAADDFTPTNWGRIAQRALAQSAITSFQPASAISHSIYATHGPALHRLTTSGSFIVDEKNAPVNLRGVTVEGLDSIAPASGQTFPVALALDDANLLELCGRWGANLIRLPFRSQTILAGNSNVSVAAMLAGLDAAVAAITQAGAYVLLALEAPAGNGTPATPDPLATQVWQMLAERYQKSSGVLFEIYSSVTPLLGNWLQVAAALVTTIRQRKPSSLIFVGSGNGGSDVTGLPLLSPAGTPVFNLVYTIAASAENLPSPDDGKLLTLAESSPVFASMWSDSGSDFGRSSAHVPDLFDRYGMGWAASSWNADPRLVVDAANHDFTSTGWGLVASRSFRLPAKALLNPFGPGSAK